MAPAVQRKNRIGNYSTVVMPGGDSLVVSSDNPVVKFDRQRDSILRLNTRIEQVPIQVLGSLSLRKK